MNQLKVQGFRNQLIFIIDISNYYRVIYPENDYNNIDTVGCYKRLIVRIVK